MTDMNADCDGVAPDRVVSFRPSADVETLRFRAGALRELRRYFDAAGFLETQTPVMSRDTVIDRHVEPLSLDVELPGRGHDTFYLQTSPEFAMKRLLASGMRAIYQFAPVFRRGDRGPVHNIEFTMLEWYRVGHAYGEGIAFLARLVDSLFSWAGRKRPSCQMVSFEQLLYERTGLSFESTSDDYRRYADRYAPNYPSSFLVSAASDDWLDYVFSERIQPTLGEDAPVILYDYPASQAQLACTRGESGGPFEARNRSSADRAERYELFASGLELANGYHELLDAEVLRVRNESTQRQRVMDGKPRLKTSGRLVAAMESGFPPTCGCALGFDRLLMVLLGKERIDDVIAFPVEEA